MDEENQEEAKVQAGYVLTDEEIKIAKEQHPDDELVKTSFSFEDFDGVEKNFDLVCKIPTLEDYDKMIREKMNGKSELEVTMDFFYAIVVAPNKESKKYRELVEARDRDKIPYILGIQGLVKELMGRVGTVRVEKPQRI